MNLESKTRTRLFIGLENQNGEIHPVEVISLVKQHVDAGTFYEGKGVWKGSTENSIIFECMDLEKHIRDAGDFQGVEDLKALLERRFDQDSVMVERTEVEAAF
jgi:hypothetical protein